MSISLAVSLFTVLVLLDPAGEATADSSRLVIHTPQKINFIHRYHTSEHYAKDYGYGTYHSHHHVHHKPKKIVHHHSRNTGGRWGGRKRYTWRKVGARTPFAGGKSYGMSNYAVNYRNWVPAPRRRNRPRRGRPRDPPRHRESYLQPPRDFSDYDSFAAHWEDDSSSSESNEIGYPSASLNSGSYHRPGLFPSPYDDGYEEDPGVVPAWPDTTGYEVGTYNVRDLDGSRADPSRGNSDNFRVSYKVRDMGGGHVQGYSTLPDELVSSPATRQGESVRPSQQPQHSFRSTSNRDQSFGSSSTQHRHQPPPSNIPRKQNSAVPQTRPHRNRPSEQDVYLQAFQAFSYRKQPQQLTKSRSETSVSHGGMWGHWPQETEDDHDIGYGEGLEDLNDQFRF